MLRKGEFNIARKRANGEGTIIKRKDGRWECRIVVGRDENGKLIRKNALAKTQKELMEKLKALKEKYEGVVVSDSNNYTVAEWLNKWLDEYKKPFIRLHTYDAYREAIKIIKREIGEIRLSKLKTADIQKMYNHLREDGRQTNREERGTGISPNYIKKIHVILHGALEYALNDGLIQSNPSSTTQLPKVEKKNKKVLLEEEVERFIEEIDKMPYWRDLFYLELMTGLRRGEICGLMWSDLDEKNSTLHIQRSISYRKRELLIGEPKTEEGKRTIILPDSAVEMLLERQKEAVGKWIFPRTDNPEQPLVPSYAYLKLQEILKNAGIGKMRFHDLRHTFATHAAKNGVDPKTLAGLLGHTNASFTLDTYTHVTTDMQKVAANVVEKFVEDLLGDDENLINQLIL